jgi:hypothetical protein
LVNDYLTDEEQGALSGRNPISSINDVLREGRFLRDKLKVRALPPNALWPLWSNFFVARVQVRRYQS